MRKDTIPDERDSIPLRCPDEPSCAMCSRTPDEIADDILRELGGAVPLEELAAS